VGLGRLGRRFLERNFDRYRFWGIASVEITGKLIPTSLTNTKVFFDMLDLFLGE
jgi:hypothetical protein